MTPDDATHPLESPRPLPVPLPSSVSLTRSRPNTLAAPLAVPAATGHPTPHRRAQKLRHFVLDPLAEVHNVGRIEAPPPTPSSSSGCRDRLRCPAHSGPSASSPT